MSHPLKREYGFALVMALVLHIAAVISWQEPPKGNAPVEGYRLEFSLGAYGGADSVIEKQRVEDIIEPEPEPEPEVIEEPDPVEEMVQKVIEPEPIPEVKADFSLKKEEEKLKELVKEVEPPKPIEPEKVVVKEKPKPRVKPKLMVKPKPKPKPEPIKVVKKIQSPDVDPTAKKSNKVQEIEGAKAFDDVQTFGGGGVDKSVTSGVSGGIRGVHTDYRALLHKYISRHKKYPRRARLRRQEGTVVVTFSVSSNGGIKSMKITKSSGHRLLDKEALAMLKRAAPLPLPPKGIGDLQEYVLPIPFSLRSN